MLTTLTVNSSADNVTAGDGLLTLREAINAANDNLEPDTINFSTNPAYGLNGGTILLSQSFRQLAITDSLTIDASMLADGLTIDAANGTDGQFGTGDGFRIFDIHGSGTLVTLNSLTLTGGDMNGTGGVRCQVMGAPGDIRLALAA